VNEARADPLLDANSSSSPQETKTPFLVRLLPIGIVLTMAATAAAAPAYKSDIPIGSDYFETMTKRAFTTIRLYCSVVQSDDADWKIDLAVDAVEAMGICSEFVAQCFLLHNQKDLLFKEPSDQTWRQVKVGIFSTITIKAVSIASSTGAGQLGGSNDNTKHANNGVLTTDDSSMSMILEKAAEMEWDETTHEKENLTTPSLPPIRQILIPTSTVVDYSWSGGRSSWCSNNNSHTIGDMTMLLAARPKPRYSVSSDITTGAFPGTYVGPRRSMTRWLS
jgi:hypothetical protein